MLKKLKAFKNRKQVTVKRGHKSVTDIHEILENQGTTIQDLQKSGLVSSKIQKEPPLSIDATRPKLSLKQVFIKRSREYPRLPTTVIPNAYHIHLSPQLDLFTYEGEVIILIEIEKPIKKIVLNSADLQVKHASIHTDLNKAQESDRDKQKTLKFELRPDDETLEIMLESLHPLGTCALKILFSGVVKDQMKGFHYSRYESKNQLSFYYLTKCEPCDARRVFPCFDEPQFKTHFSLTIIVPKSKIVLSNTMESKVSPAPSKRYKIVSFEQSEPMSTFMFCFVIGDFEYVAASSNSGTLVRVYTPPQLKREGKFALKLAVKAVEFIQATVDVPYPLRKLDLIPIREMSIDFQCSWGIVIFGNDAILTNEFEESAMRIVATTSMDYQNIALLVARAVAGQWAENLVTLKWWSDTWLNLGLSSYLKFITVHAVFQSYNVWPQFATLVTEVALRNDVYEHSHPLICNLDYPPDIEEVYDIITHNKGAAILRMISGVIGDDHFRKGLHEYFVQHASSAAVSASLWSAFETTSKMAVAGIMTKWTETAGFPLIRVLEVAKNHGVTTIRANQERFLSAVEEPKTGKWAIPINVISSVDPHNIIHSEVVEDKNFELKLEGVSNAKWFLLNPVRTGYYRVMYPAELMEQLGHSIHSQRIGFLDRAVLLQDEFAMALAGYKSFADVFILLQAFTDEVNYHVWLAIDDVVHVMDRYLSYASKMTYTKFQEHILEIYSRAEERFGFAAFQKNYPPVHVIFRYLRFYCNCFRQNTRDLNEDHVALLLHGLIIRRMCIFGHVKTVEWAKDMYIFHANEQIEVHPDIYRAVLLGFIQWKPSEESLYLILKSYMKSQSMQEKEHIMEAFGMFNGYNEIRKILQFSISKSVSLSHTPQIMVRCAVKKLGRHMAWEFFKEHNAHFSREYYQNEQLLVPIFQHIIAYFMTEERLQDVEKFFRGHPFQGLEKHVDICIDSIRRNIAWAKRDLEITSAYLHSLVSRII